MSKIAVLVVVTCSIFGIAGCSSRELNREEAKQVIEKNDLIRPADAVSINAISSTSPTEAVVRATLAGQTVNLKFRRFDNGWAWEFVETRGGGWIAPDVVIAQIREEQRQVAASRWAEEHKDGYKTTATTISFLASVAPNPKVGMDVQGFLKIRGLFSELIKDSKDPEKRVKYETLSNDHPKDAWGNELLMAFSGGDDPQSRFVSVGPDKTQGTPDDMVCIVKPRGVIEQGDLAYSQDSSWIVPEGLGSLVEEFTDKPYGSIEFSKVVKP